MPLEFVDPNWRKKYKTLKEFYDQEYDKNYFSFTSRETEIDPMEAFEDIEKYDSQRQYAEKIKCAMSFSYFCHKYVKIAHPKMGLLPFVLYDYQRRCIKEYEAHRFNILSKFRQGGLTTVTVLWCMWRCMFKMDETIMVVSKSDREAIAAGEIVKRALIELPKWMQLTMDKNNDHQKLFNETGCKLFFYTPEAARGRSITYLILDEAAFIPGMEKHWKAIFPTIATGGHCICISTVNGVGNWYYDIFHEAKRGDNDFNIIELDYEEHPEYNDPDWVKIMRAQLGEKGWMQEIMRDFLGAGDSYIPSDIINDLDLAAKEIKPLKMLFQDLNNPEEAKEAKIFDLDNWQRGALHIWREPIEGREYIIGADAAGGMGGENDNSCFEVIDAVTCEQVAEFYSNVVPTYNFASILCLLGRQYNNAQIIIEDQGYGNTVLEKLVHDFKYENLFECRQGNSKISRPGIKTSSSTRPKFIECLETRLRNRTIAIKSRRFIKELKGFIWNSAMHRAEATKGFHDDAIMALALALYAREMRSRDLGAGDKVENHSEAFKAQIFQNLKDELKKSDMDFWKDEDYEYEMEDRNSIIARKYKRENDALLREFGF